MDPKYDTEFKLTDDETMRRLRVIAETPGDRVWRMEVLATLERMRINDEVRRREWGQALAKIRADIRHLTPKNLAEFVNAQIEQKRKEGDSSKWRNSRKWILSHVGTSLLSLAAAYALNRLKH